MQELVNQGFGAEVQMIEKMTDDEVAVRYEEFENFENAILAWQKENPGQELPELTPDEMKTAIESAKGFPVIIKREPIDVPFEEEPPAQEEEPPPQEAGPPQAVQVPKEEVQVKEEPGQAEELTGRPGKKARRKKRVLDRQKHADAVRRADEKDDPLPDSHFLDHNPKDPRCPSCAAALRTASPAEASAPEDPVNNISGICEVVAQDTLQCKKADVHGKRFCQCSRDLFSS
jgi:hypothetical protein